MEIKKIEQFEDWKRYLRAKETISGPISSPVIAYGGTAGSYTEDATIDYFGEDSMRIACRSFRDVFKSITGGSADYGVIPIENSTTGSVKDILDFLREYNCYIVGETEVRIDHALLGLPGASLFDIKDVYAHEQSFMQCEEYLSSKDWELHPYINNAIAAAHIAKEGEIKNAAIASERAASIYGLKILDTHINFLDINTTRFIVISSRPEIKKENNKISVTFAVDHRPGALVRVLNIFDRHKLNLCKIESRPNHVKNWEYNFFVDIEGSLIDKNLDEAIKEVVAETVDFRFLGSYQANLN